MIIDFRVRLPATEFFSETVQTQPGFMRRYQEMFDFEELTTVTPEVMVTALREAGIDRAVLQAEFEHGDARAMNQAVRYMVDRYPGQFIGYGTVDPAGSENMARDVEELVKEMGLMGVNLQPWVYKVHANDKIFYPVYQKCLELGIPVTIHTGINYSVDRSIKYGHPLVIDEIACDFPDLIIVANHAGWPWVAEMVAVARKHKNVYLETGGVAPKYLARPGSGWEVFFQFANTVLQDQVLFATDSVIPYDRGVSEFKELPFKPQVKEKILGGNAQALLERIAATGQ